MTIIEGLRAYIEGFPLLSGGVLHVDFLPASEAAYCLEVSPGVLVNKTYMDGSSRRQVQFVLASRQPYGPDILQQIDNIRFFDQFVEWLDGRKLLRKLPELGDGRKCTDITVNTCGYAFAEQATTAAYQIQMQVEYLQKGAI